MSADPQTSTAQSTEVTDETQSAHADFGGQVGQSDGSYDGAAQDPASQNTPSTNASTSEAKEKSSPATDAANSTPAPSSGPDLALLEKEGEIAADYLEGLLDIADLDGDIDMDVEGQRSSVAIVGDGLDDLVGEDGKCLEALQELTRLAVHVKTGQRSGLMLDIADYRKDRREDVTRITHEAIASVQASGTSIALEPMTPFERKVVHDVVAAAGLNSSSQGYEPDRHVVILPATERQDNPVPASDAS